MLAGRAYTGTGHIYRRIERVLPGGSKPFQNHRISSSIGGLGAVIRYTQFAGKLADIIRSFARSLETWRKMFSGSPRNEERISIILARLLELFNGISDCRTVDTATEAGAKRFIAPQAVFNGVVVKQKENRSEAGDVDFIFPVLYSVSLYTRRNTHGVHGKIMCRGRNRWIRKMSVPCRCSSEHDQCSGN